MQSPTACISCCSDPVSGKRLFSLRSLFALFTHTISISSYRNMFKFFSCQKLLTNITIIDVCDTLSLCLSYMFIYEYVLLHHYLFMFSVFSTEFIPILWIFITTWLIVLFVEMKARSWHYALTIQIVPVFANIVGHNCYYAFPCNVRTLIFTVFHFLCFFQLDIIAV